MYIDVYAKKLNQINGENNISIVYRACYPLIQPLFIQDQWCFNNILCLKEKADISGNIKKISSNHSTLKQKSFVRDTV